MAATLKIDGYDFYQYVRVAPGEGFDPASPGFQEPQFGETVNNDEQPLISVNERNKELAWPVHLNAANKDALHDLLIDVNRRLSKAIQVEWRDDGATASTFFDVVFARFDPDYNYRRGQRNWLSGTLRIWVKPYGHSGTYRLISSSMSPSWGLPVFLPATTSLDGDVPAKIRVTHLVSSIGTYTGTAYQGISVMPTTAFGFFAPSIMLQYMSNATIVGATTATGSQAMRSFLQGTPWTTLWNIAVSPSDATVNSLAVPPGRNRVLGVVRSLSTTAACTRIMLGMMDYEQDLLSATQSIAPSTNWLLIDFGVYTMATQVASEPRYHSFNGLFQMVGATTGSATGIVDVAGIYVLPEESTIITRVGDGYRTRYYTNTDESIDYEADFSGLVRRPVPNEFGVMPRLPVGTQMNKVMLFFSNNSNSVAARQDHTYSTLAPSTMYVQERFTYAR